MNANPERSISSIPWRTIGSVAGVVSMLALIALVIPQAEKPNIDPKGKVVVDSSAAQCEKDLKRILEAARPGSLGILADRNEILDQLNAWQRDCGKVELDAPLADDAALRSQLLAAEQLAVVNGERFLPRDMAHLRLCFLMHSIVTKTVSSEQSDRARVVKLFNFVVKNVVPVADASPAGSLTFTPYEALLFGRGTAAQQAWTFGMLLRQMRLDAVILRPKTAGKSNYLLVGVHIPRTGILLFDPQAGMMIPSLEKDDGGLVASVPATLAEARGNDQVFRQLDMPEFATQKIPYPLTSADLNDLSVELIGTSSDWSERMAQLQYLLPGDMNLVVYDGLGQNALRQPGYHGRIVEAGTTEGWTAEQVRVWDAPETQVLAFEKSQREEGAGLASMFQMFAGPTVVRVDPTTGQQRQGSVDKNLHVVRLEQILGEHTKALGDYLPIRTAAGNNPTPQNLGASDHAEFWTGVSQYELGRYETAFGTFQRYIQDHPNGGFWSRDALEWMVRCLLGSGATAEGAQLLAQSPPGPRYVRDVWLLQRWARLLGVKNEPEPANPSKEPASAPQPPETPAVAEPSPAAATSTPSPESVPAQRPAPPALPEPLTSSEPTTP